MKPRVAYLCVEGSSLSWARRLADEGCDVLVYHASREHSRVGDGIVPLCASRERWLEWGMADAQTLWFFDCTSSDDYDSGVLADRLRAAGRHVVGGGTFCDRLEKDRAFGAKLAVDCGITAPPTHEFSSVAAAAAFARSTKRQQYGDGGWAWKADRYLGQSATYVGEPDEVASYLETMIAPRHGDRIKCILQERIPGVALSTARWWNGMRFVGPFEGTLEHKKFMDGDVGPSTGCSFNALWFYREGAPKIARALHFDAIESAFRAKRAPPGLYDVNAVADRRAAWFLEWTPRLGMDSELASQRGIASLAEFLFALARGEDVDHLFDREHVYMSLRLSVPPYPADKVTLATSIAMGVPVVGNDGLWNKMFVAVGLGAGPHGLQVSDPYGFVGCAVTADASLERGYARIEKFVKDALVVPDLQYRTDAAATLQEDVAKLAKAGYWTTDVLDSEGEAA